MTQRPDFDRQGRWMRQTVSPRTLADLQALIGVPIAPAEGVEVTQEALDRFADATDDHQWIHVDPDRAANGPFGTTIAHGLLTLPMLPGFLNSLPHMHG